VIIHPIAAHGTEGRGETHAASSAVRAPDAMEAMADYNQ
jgi:hypothetical protein